MKKKDFFLILIVSFIGLGSLSTLGYGAFYIWYEALNKRHEWWWFIFAIFGSLVFLFFLLGLVLLVKQMITEAREK